MVRHQWIVGLRNQLSSLAGECDSAAAINGAKLSEYDRYKIQKTLGDLIEYIDDRIA